MILARLIAPEDFGLLAIAMIFVGLGMIISNQGFTPALVQKKELSHNNIQAAILLSVVSGLVLFCIVWLLAPVAASFFNEPRALNVVRATGLIFLFNGFSSVGRGILMREFRYKPLFFIEVGSFVVGYGILGITLAVLDYGVWSLVLGVITQYALMAVCYLVYVGFSFKIVFRNGEYRKLLRFGSGVSLLSFLNYSAMNVDNLIIGRALDSQALGFYSKAFGLMQVPVTSLSYTIGSVSMSAFSAIQDNTDRLKRAYLKAINIIFMVAAPLAVIMVISAEYFVLGVYGPDWNGAVEAFRILSIGILFKVFFGISGSMAKATNNVFKETIRQLIFAVCVTIFGLLFLPLGIEGIALAVTLASFIFFILMIQLSLKLCKAKFTEFLISLKSGAWLGFSAMISNVGIVILLQSLFDWLPVPAKMVIILAFCSIICLVFFLRAPASIMGENRHWLIQTYSAYLPAPIRQFILKLVAL